MVRKFFFAALFAAAFLVQGCVSVKSMEAGPLPQPTASLTNAYGDLRGQRVAPKRRVFRKKDALLRSEGTNNDVPADTSVPSLLHRKRAASIARPILDEVERAMRYLDSALKDAPMTKVSINTKDAPTLDVIKALCDQAKVSLVVVESPKPQKLSMSFRNVPFARALRNIADATGLSIRYKDGVVTVKNSETITLKLPLMFFDQSTSFSSGNVSISVSASFANEFQRPVKHMLGKGGSLVFDKTSGFVTLTGKPSGLRMALNFIHEFATDMSEYLGMKVFILRVNEKSLRDRGVSFDDANIAIPVDNYPQDCRKPIA